MEVIEEKHYKTAEYQRKAYQKYYNKIKDTDEFKQKSRNAQKSYYERNRDKILERKRLKREAMKKKEEEE
tara:strand:- start:500 stop:709 length:210 start_codon:yes stop_codon:yes gene_type:complete